MNSTPSNADGFWMALKMLLVAVGGFLAANGMGQSTAYRDVMLASGGVMILGPSIWQVIVEFKRVDWVNCFRAVNVQAGINLVVSGKALAGDGKTVVSKNDGSTPPLQVTTSTAKEISKDFAPAPSTISKS